MKKCLYCQENDESKLIMSSRLVNGTVKTIDICFRCFWLDKFRNKEEGKEMNGVLSERETIEGIESIRSINPLGLQE